VGEVLIDDYADEKHLTKTLYNLLENDVWIIINHNDTLHPTELNSVLEKNDNDKNTVFISELFNNFFKKKVVVKRVIYLTNTN
jgi:glutamate 5-kinase